MAYEFTEWDDQPEVQASSVHSGGPPRKGTVIGILGPGEPPEKHPYGDSVLFVVTLLAWLIFAGLIAGIVLMLLSHP
jgi:hypothetical protein